MKIFCVLVALIGLETFCIGSPSPLEPPDVKWTAPTNNWCKHLWVYRVVTQSFSPTVISNLLSISGFTEKDRAKVPRYLGEKDKNVVFYGDLEGTRRHLAICPALGLIEYVDPKAQAASQLQKVEGVPNEHEATQLGLKYLRLFAVDVDQIAHKTETCDLDLRWQKDTILFVDPTTKREVTLTNGYGVLFARRIDGIKVHGFGGMDIVFGNNAKISSVTICWRNLQPHELLTIPSPQQIVEQLQKGKIQLHPLGSSNTYPLQEVKKLTVTKCTFFYEGKFYDEAMDFVRPYVSFEGVADNGKTETGVWFEWCP